VLQETSVATLQILGSVRQMRSAYFCCSDSVLSKSDSITMEDSCA
jgi:hypothetical protein